MSHCTLQNNAIENHEMRGHTVNLRTSLRTITNLTLRRIQRWRSSRSAGCVNAINVSSVTAAVIAVLIWVPSPVVAEAQTITPVSTTAGSPTQPPVQSAEQPSATGESNPPTADNSDDQSNSASESNTDSMADDIIETPWDYDPYRVLIWIITDDHNLSAGSIATDLKQSLAREFDALWRLDVRDASASVATLAMRDLSLLSYDAITASDAVIAIKKDHPQAVRLRTPDNVAEFVKEITAASWRADSLVKGLMPEHEQLAEKFKQRFVPLVTDEQTAWENPDTEAILTSRGTAATMTKPEAKLIDPPTTDLVAAQIDQYDKIFFVRAERNAVTPTVSVVEMDTLMRHFGAPVTLPLTDRNTDVAAIASNVVASFRPVVRIDNAGQKEATAMVRGGGLIISDDSPGRIKVGDILEPMIRKDDRNGNPFVIGPMDWAFLVATEADNRIVKMDFWAGRTGGLQGRKNNRTFKMGLRVKPRGRGSLLRLHAKGNVDEPLIGYEIYEKALDSKEMSFVGRTDWDGRLQISPSDGPFRLLYVKNGGAILARLPLVPGLHDHDVANLVGDDDRLQAEAYVRGVQSDIIDLVALRELFKARVRMRLENGEMDKAEELMVGLRQQPNSQQFNDEIGKKKVMFLKTIDNPSQRKKVDNMFSSTQDLLSKFINPKLIQDLEIDIITAKKNGGRLAKQKPVKPEQPEE